MSSPYTSALVVGGHGFIGRHLIKHLTKQGLEVRVPDRGDESWMGAPQGLVVWAAGYTADYAENPAATIEAHSGALARYLAAKPKYEGLVYLSSTRLYDGIEGSVDETTPLALDPANPRHLYDLSKGLGEWLIRHHAGPRGRVVRLSCVYGDGLDGGSFLEEMIGRALDGRAGEIDTSPDVARDYVHVEDVCRAVWAIANAGTEPLYVVGSGETVDNHTLLGILSERTGVALTPARAPTGTFAPVLDLDRLATTLGIQPKVLSDGLDRVLTFQHNQRAMRSMLGVTKMPWM